jgi:predicted RNA binding protein with dsRBD fold (UPF0201 family)
MDVHVSAPIFPSEDPDKVVRSITNIFPSAELEISEGKAEGKADMENFSMQIRRQKILDAARSVMFKRKRGPRTVFHLNKQAAFAGRISFSEERAVLGTITVTVEDGDIDAAIDTVAPATMDGKEVRI